MNHTEYVSTTTRTRTYTRVRDCLLYSEMTCSKSEPHSRMS